MEAGEGPIRPEQVIQDKKELTNEQVKIINRLILQCYIPYSNECVMAVPFFAEQLGIPIYYCEPLVTAMQTKYEPLGWKVTILKRYVDPRHHFICFTMPLKGNKE
jgi:hypothetical protein